MATMYGCAMDWTFDLAYADAQKASALPMPNGVYRHNETLGVQLFTYLKTCVKFAPKTTTPWDDAWETDIDWSLVSDWYKDAYGQRPHFDNWYWRGLLGVYQPIRDLNLRGQVGIMLDKAEDAKWLRERLMEGM